MLSKIINKQICQKNRISYLLFDKNFVLLDYNEGVEDIIDDSYSLRYGVDVRELVYDFVGLEEEILELEKNKNKVLSFPMIKKQGNFYDLDIETLEADKKETFLIAYYTQKSKKSLEYIEMIKKINKKTLHFETSDKKYKEQINNRLISFHVNKDGFITECNDAFCYYFNIEEDNVLNTHFSNFFRTRESDLNKEESVIFTTKNANNKEVYFHANILPLKREEYIYENLVLCQDISYLKEVNKQLEYVSEFDTLTGLPNRTYLLKHIDKAIGKNKPFLLCIIDFNNFKKINEEHGHHAGDMLLKHFAKITGEIIRKEDILARLRGDEFIVMFNISKKVKNIDATIKRIEEIPSKYPLAYTEEDTIHFSFSLTSASYPEDGTDSEALIRTLRGKVLKQKIS